MTKHRPKPDVLALLICDQIIPDNHFGTAVPGENFGASWRVTVKGTKSGVSHKSCKWPQAVIECKIPAQDGEGSSEPEVMLLYADKGCG